MATSSSSGDVSPDTDPEPEPEDPPKKTRKPRKKFPKKPPKKKPKNLPHRDIASQPQPSTSTGGITRPSFATQAPPTQGDNGSSSEDMFARTPLPPSHPLSTTGQATPETQPPPRASQATPWVVKLRGNLQRATKGQNPKYK